ncbi:MAG: efflux RND transporter periplasmic adaptor subunit [Deltaproteobacteria bacterium]|nr:efflux RND transporter periplasmic adaptor subunit [Deltaproteobacteria bacterium]
MNRETMTRVVARIVLPILVLAVGVAAMMILIKTRPEPGRQETAKSRTWVTVVSPEASQRSAVVQGMGTVTASRTVMVMPEVAGRVVEVHPELVPGGRVKAGEIIARVDDRDYRIAIEQQKANLARAQFELKVESGRGTIAKKEWGLLEEGVATTEQGRGLALRKPHMETAKAAVAAAKSGLDLVRLNLDRCSLRAPFNALVLKESVEVGQLIGPQSMVATLVGTDQYWVQVSVSVDELEWIDIPGLNAEQGATARIIDPTAKEGRGERQGRVVRLLGDLDPVGRMARLLVAVDDPLGTGEGRPGLPLLLGSYVQVEIEGMTKDAVFQLPRKALRDGDLVWIMDGSDKLDIRPVQVWRRMGDRVFVTEGLEVGDRVVTSRLATPIKGLDLRTGTDDVKANPVADKVAGEVEP